MHIELWAEPLTPAGEARLLFREIRKFGSNPIPALYLNHALEYEINRISELAQLKISTYDQYGRPVAMKTIDLILLAVGESDINPSPDTLESIVISEPAANQLIQGGSVYVEGLARPEQNPYLLVELIASDSTVVGYQQVAVDIPPDGKHAPFRVEVPYSVDDPTRVRLTIKEIVTRIPGVRNLSSVEVLLSP